MDVYSDRIPVGSIKDITWFKKGRFATRLVGVNVTQKEEQVNVEPVYLPLLAVDKEGGTVFITLSGNKPWLLIVLFPLWPFIHVERTDAIQLETE